MSSERSEKNTSLSAKAQAQGSDRSVEPGLGFGGLDVFLGRAQPECVITGCGLRDGLAWSWGDLHRFGGLWIFHGASHATDWLSYDAPVREPQEKALVLEDGVSYFVRRGVWVISTMGTRLNPRAIAYLKGEKK